MFENYIFPILLLAGTGLVCAVMLSLAAKFMAVKTDERFTKLRSCLPGANCGACGYAGCDDYAKKLLEGVATNLCIPGGDGVAKDLAGVLGVEAEDVKERYGVVKCNGDCAEAGYIMDYCGHESCAAANQFFSGRGKCAHGCLGYGDCALICEYDAIKIVNGVAYVDKQKCAGCGQCAKACPKGLIELVDYSANVYVACNSTEKGAVTRKQCKNGCIGCKKCERNCPAGAITVTNNLAYIDQDKCTSCGLCVSQCPTKAIKTCLKLIESDPPKESEAE